jgi:dTDP-4-amino-4,6-dideoxygalactose transaminase
LIPYFDYRPELAAMRREIDEAIARVIDSGQLILGPEVAAFEREFAGWVGAGAAVGVNSGTDALVLALRALDVGPGDEVITVAGAGVPPVAAVRAAGASPRFVDVAPDSLLLDPATLEAARTPRTRCVLPVHLYGQAVPMGPVLDFARRHGLAVVEDCAQAHGTLLDGRHVGTFGDVGCFSFYPTKNLAALGDGGLCLTASATLAARLRRLRMYGFEGDRHAHEEALQSRLDELQAAVLRVRLAHLDRTLAARRELARRYLEALAGSPNALPPVEPRSRHNSYHLFVVQAPDRPRLLAALDRARIGYGLHYPEPVHLMQAYRGLGYGAGSLPVTERAAARVVSLPLWPGLGEEAVAEVVRVLLDAGG